MRWSETLSTLHLRLSCRGAALLSSNLYLLPLPLMFWALLTVMMQTVEEKWLLDEFGDEYKEYCKRVNRCIPWFSKR